MNATITELAQRLAMPPDGVDLRAELDALQSARVSQALEASKGDLTQAAKLLRMSRLDLLRLEQRLADARGPRGRKRPPRFEPPPIEQTEIPHVRNGVEYVSAAAIRRLATEGKSEKEITRLLGCNPYAVEKVLREETERRVRELAARDVPLVEICHELQLPPVRVRRILARSPSSPPPAPPPRKGRKAN